MPTFSAFKNSVKSALRHDAHKPRSRRRVISFNEAFENLKASQTGFVTCAAFNSLGKCPKEITLFDSEFLANLDQLDMADIQTPIKLMPLLLCSTHWEKTVYYNALFLDWLYSYGSKKDKKQFENIVIDYESAIATENEEHSLSEVPISPKAIAGNQERSASAPNSHTKDHNQENSLQTTDQQQIPMDQNKPRPSDSETDHASINPPENSVLVEIGVPVPAPVPASEPPSISIDLEDGTSTVPDLNFTDPSSIVSQGLAGLGLTNDSPPQPEANTSSISKAVIEEAIPLEDQMGAQNARPGMNVIDSNLIKEMTSPIPQGGYVYIFKSPARKLVKIGKATDVNLRQKQIQTGCQLAYFDQVEVGSVHVKHPDRVAKLVHLELENFRARMICQYHEHEATREAVEQEHKEWFDVSEIVALESVLLWSDFVDQAYTSEGALTENWARMLTLLPNPTSAEIDSLEKGLKSLEAGDAIEVKIHHELRALRYRSWIKGQIWTSSRQAQSGTKGP